MKSVKKLENAQITISYAAITIAAETVLDNLYRQAEALANDTASRHHERRDNGWREPSAHARAIQLSNTFSRLSFDWYTRNHRLSESDNRFDRRALHTIAAASKAFAECQKLAYSQNLI